MSCDVLYLNKSSPVIGNRRYKHDRIAELVQSTSGGLPTLSANITSSVLAGVASNIRIMNYIDLDQRHQPSRLTIEHIGRQAWLQITRVLLYIRHA
jgi:hypothetical protein